MNSNPNIQILAKTLTKEFILEKGISEFEDTNRFNKKFLAAIQDLEENFVGVRIDYDHDIVARNLLKEYVFYDFYNMLPEFKERYANEITKLQLKYNSSII